MSFDAWAEWAEETKRLSVVCAKVLKRMLRAQFVGAWNAWCTYVEEKTRMDAVCKKVMNRMLRGHFVGAWNAWCLFIEEKVFGFKIPMNDALPMSFADGFE